jgi:hypothetical protein
MRRRVRRFLRGGKFSTAYFLHSFYVKRHRELLNCKGLVLRFTVPNVAAAFVAGIVRTVSIGLIGPIQCQGHQSGICNLGPHWVTNANLGICG